MRRYFALSHLTIGFIAVLIGFSSSAVIVFQAAAAAGANAAEVSSWLLALGIGMAATGIGLSFYYRIPILTAWSTPGAAFLVTALAGVSMPEAIGAFIFSGFLIFISGLSGWFEKIMVRIPPSLVSAMLAGVLLHFGLNLFIAMPQQPILVSAMFLTYLVGKRWFPQYVVILIVLFGIFIAILAGLFQAETFHFSLARPIFTMPVFSWRVLISIGLPLFIVTMTAQNITGIAVIRSAGYKPPISSLISWTGLATVLLAPWGAYVLNLAAISAAVCLSADADPDPSQRYKAAIFAGIFYFIAGIMGATIVSLFSAFPPELIAAIAGLALLGTLGSSLKIAMAIDSEREAALLTFLVCASGMTLFDIGSAFWGLIFGVLSLIVLKGAKQPIVSTATMDIKKLPFS